MNQNECEGLIKGVNSDENSTIKNLEIEFEKNLSKFKI